MSSNDSDVHGESDVFGVPTRVGPWALEEESSINIVWRRELDEADLDPEDGREKQLFEWVVVASVQQGGAWRAELRKGFRDTHMRDRPQLTQIEQAAHTDEGRDRVIEEAIAFMQERGGEADEEEPEDDEVIAEVIAEQDAETVDGWERVEPTQSLAHAQNDVLVQWEGRGGDLVVYVQRVDTDDGPKYSAKAESVGDDVPFKHTSIKYRSESLETTLDAAISWLRRHRPDVPLPEFSMRIEGGIFKPLVGVIHRFGAGDTLIEVRDDSVVFYSASNVNEVEFRIPRADMESYEVDQEGEVVIDSDHLWDSLKDVRYSDTVPVSVDLSDDRPRVGVAGRSSFGRLSAQANRLDLPNLQPPDAAFTIDGLEYRDKTKGIRIFDSESAIFGVKDGVPIARVESGDAQGEAVARFEATDVTGDLLVLVDPDRLQDLRRAMPRPSKTPISFTIKENLPMLAEYTVGDTDVDVRIALKFGPMPFDISIPPEEVTVPEDAPEPEPDEEGDVGDSLDEFAEAAAEEVATGSGAAAEGTTEDWPTHLSGYTLREATVSETNAEYNIRYLRGRTILGKQYGDDRLRIRHFDDTDEWYVDSKNVNKGRDPETFDTRGEAIDFAREVAEEATEKYEEIEREAEAEIAEREARLADDDTEVPAEIGPFELQDLSNDRVYWGVGDGTGVEVVDRNGVWVVWVRDDTGERYRLGASKDRDEAVALAIENLESYRDPRDARGAARQLNDFAMGEFRRTTGNDITGGPLQALAGYFPSIEAMEAASIQEIEAIDGVGPGTIESLQENFDFGEDDEPEPAGEAAVAVTVVSLNRPLTRSARKALSDFEIIDTRDVNDPPRWTEVDLGERPPRDLLDEHELRVVEDPIEVWEGPGGAEVRIFSDRVISEGVEAAMEPAEAAREAREQGFDPVDVPEDSPLAPEAAEEPVAEDAVTEADVEDVVASLGGAIMSAEARLDRAEEVGIGDSQAAFRVQDPLEEARERRENLSERPPELPSTKPSVRDRLSRARGWGEQLRERSEELRTAIQQAEGSDDADADDAGTDADVPDEIDFEVTVVEEDGELEFSFDRSLIEPFYSESAVDTIEWHIEHSTGDVLGVADQGVFEAGDVVAEGTIAPAVLDPEEVNRIDGISAADGLDFTAEIGADLRRERVTPTEVEVYFRETPRREESTGDYDHITGLDVEGGGVSKPLREIKKQTFEHYEEWEGFEEGDLLATFAVSHDRIDDVDWAHPPGGPDAEDEFVTRFEGVDLPQEVNGWEMIRSDPDMPGLRTTWKHADGGQLHLSEKTDEGVYGITFNPGRHYVFENAAGRSNVLGDWPLDVAVSMAWMAMEPGAFGLSLPDDALTLYLQRVVGVASQGASSLGEQFTSVADILRTPRQEVAEISGVGGTSIEALYDAGVKLPDDVPVEDDDDDPPGEATIRATLVGGSLNYVVTGGVPDPVEMAAIAAARGTLGPPGEFDVEDVVGHVSFSGTTVENIDLSPGIELQAEDAAAEAVAEEPAEPEEPEPEPEEEPEPEPDEGFGRTVEDTFADDVIEAGELEEETVPEPEPEEGEPTAAQMTRSEIKEAIETTTVGVDATAQVIGSELREVKLRPSDDAAFGFKSGTSLITTTARDTAAETVKAAIAQWDEQVDLDRLTDEQREEINEMRDLVSDQLGVAIPRLSRTVEPPEEDDDDVALPFTASEIEEILEASIEGANVDIQLTPSADSVRVRWDVPPGTGVRYTRDPREVQGAASDPMPAVVEAIEEWEDAVALESVDREVIEGRRENEEREFGISLPTIPGPGKQAAEQGTLTGLAARIQTIESEFEKVPIDPEGLEEVPGFDLPVEIKQGTSDLYDEEERTSLEQALEIHYVEEVHDEVHAQVAEVLDTEPENLWDGSKPSELPGYDLFRAFDLRRSSAPGAWTNRRFDPSTLFKLLEPLDGNKIQVLSDAGPLA